MFTPSNKKYDYLCDTLQELQAGKNVGEECLITALGKVVIWNGSKWEPKETERCVLLEAGILIEGDFSCIEAMTDISFDTLTSNVTKNDHVTPAVASDFGLLSEGRRLYIRATQIKLASGSAIIFY